MMVKMADGLPSICYVRHNVTGCLVTVRRGVPGYFDIHFGKVTEEEVDRKNAEIHVTKAQSRAMFIGSMFGWDAPGADPAHYDVDGNPIGSTV
jgi:hypothetical protein